MDIGRTTWLTYSCDGDAVTDESSFEDHRPGGNKILTGSRLEVVCTLYKCNVYVYYILYILY